MSKVVVAGSRTIVDYQLVCDEIAASKYNVTELVSGVAKGVDLLGEQWAIDRLIPVKRFAADWKKHDRAAGPIRNKEMAEYCDMAIVIWDGESKGTKNMIEQMKRLKKPCHVRIV